MYYRADDAITLEEGKNINGEAAIKQMVQATANMRGFKIVWYSKPLQLEVANTGDMAYIIFQNSLSVPDSTGKTLTTRNTAWKRGKKTVAAFGNVSL